MKLVKTYQRENRVVGPGIRSLDSILGRRRL